MNIIHFHKIHPVAHYGYRPDSLNNPNFAEVDKIQQADFVWYNAWGDGDTIVDDISNSMSTIPLPMIAVLTGDQCYTPFFSPFHSRFFSTVLNPRLADGQFQVPYSYHSSLDWYEAIGMQEHSRVFFERRRFLAGFQGSFETNPARATLKAMERADIVVVDCDGHHATQAGETRQNAEHHQLLLESDFALCPRGIGKSSIRLVEAIFRGAVPVMIDDHSLLFGDDMEWAVRWPDFADLNELEAKLRQLKDNGCLEDRRSEMYQWLNKRLLVDYHSGIHNNIGFTEWIYSKL
jgi:hypothetical protein